MAKERTHWEWYWGISIVGIDERVCRSPKRVFKNLMKLKKYANEHAKEYAWLGDLYFSTYDTVDPRPPSKTKKK